MKKLIPFLAVFIAACLILGCANTTPPSKTEAVFLNTVTNYVTVTNVVPVPVLFFRTNEVPVYTTNQLNQTVVTFTNIVIPTWTTNLVQVPVFTTNYTFTPKQEAKDVAAGAGGIINAIAPGVGSLVTEGLLAIMAGWATWRSRQKGQTSAVLVQEIETVRAFVKSLPNGATYDAALVKFLQDHQNEAGVAQQVLALLAANLSNPDAKVAAQSIIDAINALKSVPAPLAPVSVS